MVLRFYYHAPHKTELQVWAPTEAHNLKVTRKDPIDTKTEELRAGTNQMIWDCDKAMFDGTYELKIVPLDAPEYAFSNTVEVKMAKLEPTLSWPVKGTITSFFGPRWLEVRRFAFARKYDTGRDGWGKHFHEGLDLAAPAGTEIRAAAAGTVIRTGYESGGGYVVGIDHGGGVTNYLPYPR